MFEIVFYVLVALLCAALVMIIRLENQGRVRVLFSLALCLIWPVGFPIILAWLLRAVRKERAAP